MLTENGKNALPEPIVKRLDEINTLCLETMGKRIKEFGGLSPSDAHKLARQLKLGADIRMIERELVKATSKSLEDIETILNIVANDNVETSKAMLEAKGAFIPFSENKELQNWVSALAKQSQQELINLAKTTAFMRYDEKGNKVLSSLSETYNAVIDKAVASASSGVVDYKTAMRKTLKDLADSGLRTKYKKLEGSAGPTVDYASGYSRRLDTAVRQNILWGIKECNLGIQEQIGEEFSADGYEIDYHRNPRPSHAEMGGKQYVKGKARYIKGKYYESFEAKAEPLLAEYGCLHFKFPIICGISRPIYSDEELAKFKAMDNKTFEYEGKTYTGYEAKQMQRKLETAIRHAKDRQKIAKAAGDDTLRRQEQKKLNDLTRKYKDFSEKAGLPVKKERMSVSGYYRVKENLFINEEDIKISSKKLNNLYTVDREFVNSKKFHDKFDMLPLSKWTRESAYSESKKILEHRDGTAFEDIIVIDSKTGKFITSNQLYDVEFKCALTKEQYQMILSHSGNIVTIHNHAEGTRLSKADIFTAFGLDKVEASIAVGHDGSVHCIYNINRKYDIDKIYTDAYNKIIENYNNKELAVIKATNALYDSGAFNYVHF